MGGKGHDRIHAREQGAKFRFVGNVTLHQFEALHQAAKPGAEIVVDHNLVARTPQGARRMTANVACSTSDQDRQGETSKCSYQLSVVSIICGAVAPASPPGKPFETNRERARCRSERRVGKECRSRW